LAFSQLSASSPRHYLYHCDANGNVTIMINSSQAAVAKYLYDPSGNILSSSGPSADANLYRFSSKELHQASGMIYYLFRYYEPRLQRWANRDPLAEKGHMGLRRACIECNSALVREAAAYRFCENSPTTTFDIFGLLDAADCKAQLDKDMFAVAVAGAKCQAEAAAWGFVGVIGTIVGGGLGFIFGGGAPGAAIVGGGTAVVAATFDWCHYNHCMKGVKAKSDAAAASYAACMKKAEAQE